MQKQIIFVLIVVIGINQISAGCRRCMPSCRDVCEPCGDYMPFNNYYQYPSTNMCVDNCNDMCGDMCGDNCGCAERYYPSRNMMRQYRSGNCVNHNHRTNILHKYNHCTQHNHKYRRHHYHMRCYRQRHTCQRLPDTHSNVPCNECGNWNTCPNWNTCGPCPNWNTCGSCNNWNTCGLCNNWNTCAGWNNNCGPCGRTWGCQEACVC